jgi:hypothetical protein
VLVVIGAGLLIGGVVFGLRLLGRTHR